MGTHAAAPRRIRCGFVADWRRWVRQWLQSVRPAPAMTLPAPAQGGSPSAAAGDPRRPVQLLVAGGIVVTMDPERRVIAEGAVAIDAGLIVAVGPLAELEAAFARDKAAALEALRQVRAVLRPATTWAPR